MNKDFWTGAIMADIVFASHIGMLATGLLAGAGIAMLVIEDIWMHDAGFRKLANKYPIIEETTKK